MQVFLFKKLWSENQACWKNSFTKNVSNDYNIENIIAKKFDFLGGQKCMKTLKFKGYFCL